MSMGGLLCGRILRFLHSILGLFKRALCFLRRRENNIGELPFTVAVHHPPSEDLAHSPPPYGQKMDSWDSSWEQRAVVDGKIEQYRLEQEKQRTKSVEVSDGPNFFDDMVPEVKKAKKVVLKSKRSTGGHQMRNLFDFNQEDAIGMPVQTTSGLGMMEDLPVDDQDAWGEAEADDSMLAQQKQMELEQKRKARLEEHERRNRERLQKSRNQQISIS